MKTIIPFLFIVVAACSGSRLQSDLEKLKAENDSLRTALTQTGKTGSQPAIAFVQVVKFKSTLPDSEVVKIIDERKARFREVPGLVQKYYMKEKITGEYSGIYLWASEQDFQNYRQSELGKTIGQAYKTDGKPRLEVFELLFPLREL